MAGVRQEQVKMVKNRQAMKATKLPLLPHSLIRHKIILLATAILILNGEVLTDKEKELGKTRRVDLLKLGLDQTEKKLLILSGQKYRKESDVQAMELGSPRTKANLLKSIRHLQGNLDERRQMAGITIPQDLRQILPGTCRKKSLHIKRGTIRRTT